MPSDPSQGKVWDSGRKEGSYSKAFQAISWLQRDGCKPPVLPCWSFTAFSLSNIQPFSLSCSALAIKEHICMNQQLSYCHYSSLGHRKIYFLHHLPTCAKFSNKFLLSATKVTLTVGVSSTFIFTWTLLIYKPWWLSLRWPYFVLIGAYAYL